MIRLTSQITEQQLIHKLKEKANQNQKVEVYVSSLPYFLETPVSFKVFLSKIKDYPHDIVWSTKHNDILAILNQSGVPLELTRFIKTQDLTSLIGRIQNKQEPEPEINLGNIGVRAKRGYKVNIEENPELVGNFSFQPEYLRKVEKLPVAVEPLVKIEKVESTAIVNSGYNFDEAEQVVSDSIPNQDYADDFELDSWLDKIDNAKSSLSSSPYISQLKEKKLSLLQKRVNDRKKTTAKVARKEFIKEEVKLDIDKAFNFSDDINVKMSQSTRRFKALTKRTALAVMALVMMLGVLLTAAVPLLSENPVFTAVVKENVKEETKNFSIPNNLFNETNFSYVVSSEITPNNENPFTAVNGLVELTNTSNDVVKVDLTNFKLAIGGSEYRLLANPNYTGSVALQPNGENKAIFNIIAIQDGAQFGLSRDTVFEVSTAGGGSVSGVSAIALTDIGYAAQGYSLTDINRARDKNIEKLVGDLDGDLAQLANDDSTVAFTDSTWSVYDVQSEVVELVNGVVAVNTEYEVTNYYLTKQNLQTVLATSIDGIQKINSVKLLNTIGDIAEEVEVEAVVDYVAASELTAEELEELLLDDSPENLEYIKQQYPELVDLTVDPQTEKVFSITSNPTINFEVEN